jgi:cell division septation protein DedD
MSFRNRFDEDDEEERKDTEITLGLGSLLGIFFGLVLLCGLFFGFGYSLGHGHTTVQHTNPSAATPETPSTTSALTTSGSKPAAQQLAPPPPAPADPNAAQTAATTTSAGATTPAATTTTQTQAATAPQQPAATPQQQQTASTGAAQQVFQNAVPRTPAQTATTHQYMVQVAAVSRPQDATVLVAALGQRGFHAVTRSEPQDHLMHVQIGPFSTTAAANQVRARLIADGYNAIIKQ